MRITCVFNAFCNVKAIRKNTQSAVYTTLPNYSMKYLVMCKVYTDLGGISNTHTMGCPPVRKIIHSLKLVDYLQVQADNS